jgi:GNAT superfamily N-acetyltransferase
VELRPATKSDADELLRLATVMFIAIGADPAASDWRERAPHRLAAGFDDGTVAGFVVEHPERDGALVAAALASINQRLPTPANPDGRVAYVQWVATDLEFRRQGAARALMNALLQWARDQQLAFVDLHASAEGAPLYRSLGFKQNANPELRLRLA